MNTTNSNTTDESDSWEREYRAIRLRNSLKIIGAFIGLLGVLAAIPWAFGYGPFGASLFSQEDSEIHVMNNTNEPATLTAKRLGGLFGASQTFDIGPRQIKSFGLLGGRHSITLKRGDDRLLNDEVVILSRHLFVTTEADACYAVFDIEPLYTGQGGAPSSLPVVARFGPNQLLYGTDADNLVLPRKVHPGRKTGTIEWVEDFNCNTVAPENEETLQEVALNTLTLRQQQLEEARERRQRAIERAR